ncbi:carboxyl-terminal processing protease [Ketogulonicigenium robustum]|uniref:Carboxyl-terminal processing protease n=1 Tax=Ketogulonicigenium robustum TaxID=92947 RepID=A0A1W6P2R3_9RHOB|nr:S41 family peptidase [Ketogulonicigenium robustum]ARO15577.1 carboxyl-terminal processing protease [Ketogulonicigenium robustum]
MKKYLVSALGGTALGLLVTTQFAAPLMAQQEDSQTLYEQLDLFGTILERIRANYVEEVDEKQLIEAAINGMLTSLDPHSSYLSADAAADMRVQTRGAFGGLGLEVTQEDGWVKVVSPMDGTPAEAAGLQAGDFITAVDGQSTMGLVLDDAVELMRGPVGSEVTLTIAREGSSDTFDVALVRDTIRLTAARARTEGNSVVLRLTTFSDQTYDNMASGLAEQIEAAGGIDNVDGVVIDLRNNPGGLLNQAIYVADAFLDSGEIVSTRGRDPAQSERYNATPGDLIEGKPLVVLINGGSASASEIVAGALQDHGRAIVVGTQSFGKGSVQTLMPLEGEAAMRLTTARYYTPSGRSIQAVGVSPDIIVEQPQPRTDEAETPNGALRTEASLRGSLNNDSLTDDERQHLEEQRARAEATAALRQQDYQMAYAIDILTGLSAMNVKAAE